MNNNIFLNAFYVWMVGFVVLFWAADPVFLGLWTGCCFGWALKESAKANAVNESVYGPRSAGGSRVLSEKEQEELKAYIADTKYTEPFYDFERERPIPNDKRIIRFKSSNRIYRGGCKMEQNRKLQGTRLFISVSTADTRDRLLKRENLTDEEFRLLKEKMIIPNKFTEEEKDMILLNGWRNREYFHASELLGSHPWDDKKERPASCYTDNHVRLDYAVTLNFAFHWANGYDLFD